jgi:hypothetical protein
MIRKHTLTGTLAALAVGAAVAAPAGAQPTDLRSPDAKDAARPAITQDLRSPDATHLPQPVSARDRRSLDAKVVRTQDLRSPDAKESWAPTSAAGLRAEAQERYYSSHGLPAHVPPAAEVASDGFEWGTAGIGLATGAGLALLSLGGVAITRRRVQGA